MVLGKAWSSLPVAAPTTTTSRSNDEGFGAHAAPTPQNPTALLVSELSGLLRDLPRGSVVVAASDVLLGLPGGVSFDFSASSLPSDGVIGLAVPAPLHTAKNHGVFVLEPYSEHVSDNDRLDLSGNHHDGGARNDGGGGVRDIEEGDGAASSKREERRKVAEGEGMRLRPMTVTCFLQKPSPDVMKGTHHCTFGDDLSYKGGNANGNGNDSSDIIPNNTAQTEQECAWIDTGVVVFLPEAAEQLRALAGGALRCCTHRGLQAMYDKERANDDSGGDGSGSYGTIEYAKNHTVKVELYTHLMLALSTAGNGVKLDLDKQDKRRQGRGLQAYVDEHTTSQLSSELLTEIYTRLSKLPFRAAAVPAGRFVHLGTTSELLDFLICGSCLGKLPSSGPRGTLEVDAGRKSLGKKIGLRNRFNSFALGVEPGNDDNNVLLSSVLLSLDPAQAGRIGSGTVVEHSSLRCPHLVVGNNCLVSGIRGTSSASVVIPDGMCFQMMPLSSAWASPGGSEENGYSTAMPGVSSKNYVFVYLAVNDPIKAASTIYGIPVDCLLKLTRLTESDLWDDSIEKDKRMLWNARIHPVLECSSGDPDDVILSLQPLRWITFLTSSGCIGGKDDGIVLSAEAQASLDLWRSLPRLSLSEVRNLADPEAEFAYRSSVNNAGVAVAKSRHLNTVRHIMLGRKHLQTDFRYVVDSFVWPRSIEGDASEALSCLDKTLLTAMNNGDLDIVGRAFMVIGDLLRALGSTFADGIEAQGRPLHVANEEQWRICVDALRSSEHSSSNQDKRVEIAKKLVSLRDQALSTALCRRLLYFLAAKYEEAAFALTEVCVLSSAAATSSRRSSGFGTSNKAGIVTTNTPLAAGTWAVATAPARIDLQGG